LLPEQTGGFAELHGGCAELTQGLPWQSGGLAELTGGSAEEKWIAEVGDTIPDRRETILLRGLHCSIHVNQVSKKGLYCYVCAFYGGLRDPFSDVQHEEQQTRQR